MKKLWYTMWTVLLILALVGCANVGPDDFMAGEMEELRAENVQKAAWWQEDGGTREEAELSAEQIQTVVSEINRLGKQGVHGAENGNDDAVGICLEVSDQTWEVRRSGGRNRVEIRIASPDYSVREKSKVLTELLEQLAEQ